MCGTLRTEETPPELNAGKCGGNCALCQQKGSAKIAQILPPPQSGLLLALAELGSQEVLTTLLERKKS